MCKQNGRHCRAEQMTLLVASPMNAVGEGMRTSCSCGMTSTHTQQLALLAVDGWVFHADMPRPCHAYSCMPCSSGTTAHGQGRSLIA